MALSQWLGRFTVSSSNDSFTVDATAKTCTAGNYYMRGYTGEGTVQFIEHMEDLIAAVVASSTVTYSTTTGFITITFGSSTHTITWTDADLKTLLGFDGVNTAVAAASFTGLMPPKYVWSPDVAISDAPVDPSRIVQPISSTRVHVSRDGTLVTVEGNTRYAADVEYSLIAGARVFVPSTGSINQELETFFTDVIARGELIRILPAIGTYAATTDYITAKVGSPGEEIGAFDRFARKHVRSYQGLASVRLPVLKYVS